MSARESLVKVECPLCGSSRQRAERELKGFSLERCVDCEFVFVNPRPTEADLDAIYRDRDTEALVALYSRIATPAVLAGYQKKLERIESALPGRGRLLDFACAAGYFFEQATKRGWEAHGTDMAPWASAAAAARGLQNLHVARLEDLDFPDGYFDVINASQVFEHLPQPHGDLAHLRRLLRPGGLLCLDVPNYGSLSIRLGFDDFELNGPPQHLNYFAPRTFRKLLVDGQFVIERLWTEGGVKWENFFGRRTRSDIANAYRVVKEPATSSDAAGPAKPATRSSSLKRAFHPVVKGVLYDRALMGMGLRAFARKPPR